MDQVGCEVSQENDHVNKLSRAYQFLIKFDLAKDESSDDSDFNIIDNKDNLSFAYYPTLK